MIIKCMKNKTYSINFDGKQFFVRFPLDISRKMNITREDKVVFALISAKSKSNVPKGEKIIRIKLECSKWK